MFWNFLFSMTASYKKSWDWPRRNRLE